MDLLSPFHLVPIIRIIWNTYNMEQYVNRKTARQRMRGPFSTLDLVLGINRQIVGTSNKMTAVKLKSK
jgi:hypothetical protein